MLVRENGENLGQCNDVFAANTSKNNDMIAYNQYKMSLVRYVALFLQ